LRILLVEDDDAVAGTTALWLRLQGHEVRSARNGRSALAQVGEFGPQVVLLDIGLPDMDGYEVARRLRARPEGRDLVLVAVTGYGHEEARERSRAAGFDHHLVKPVEPDTLNGLLAKLG
jgi:two-component system CheB/CheR fusion protein